MFEFRNVLDVTYGAYVVQGAYSGVGSPSSTSAPDRDVAVAIIRELMRGDTASVRQSAKNASTAVSIVQIFKEALDEIQEKLAKMKGLTGKADSEVYTQVEKEDMQDEFEDLAEEINEIVKAAEYDHNKLFTPEGKSISIPIGNGSVIDIFAKDLSVDIEGLDLTTDASGAGEWVDDVTGDVSEYNAYLNRQYRRLENATAIIEFEMASVTGIETSDFDMSVAREVAGYAASKVVEDMSLLFGIQANAEPGRVLQLLKDNVEKLVENHTKEEDVE